VDIRFDPWRCLFSKDLCGPQKIGWGDNWCLFLRGPVLQGICPINHLAFYAGWPRVCSAVPAFESVFASRAKHPSLMRNKAMKRFFSDEEDRLLAHNEAFQRRNTVRGKRVCSAALSVRSPVTTHS
jgi:hypothetical protein